MEHRGRDHTQDPNKVLTCATSGCIGGGVTGAVCHFWKLPRHRPSDRWVMVYFCRVRSRSRLSWSTFWPHLWLTVVSWCWASPGRTFFAEVTSQDTGPLIICDSQQLLGYILSNYPGESRISRIHLNEMKVGVINTLQCKRSE